MEFDRLLLLFRALNENAVEYVLVGGVAMNVQGLVRGTDDVDLFVDPTADNVERLRRALRVVWDDPEIDGIRIEDLAGDYATVRYGPPGDEVSLDIIARLGETFRFADLAAETLELSGIPIRVATPATLYRMKRDTLRDDDRRDTLRLREHFELED